MSDSNIALITGAAGNLGREVVKVFNDHHFKVHGSIEPGKNPKTDKQAMLVWHEVDLKKEESALTFVKDVVNVEKRIDACLMLVGGFAMGDIHKTRISDIREMIRLNFETAFHIARPVFQQMITQEGGGKLVFIGSKPALEVQAGKGLMAYALSKSLLFQLAEMLNAEGEAQQVTASVVVPSIIDTPLNRNAMPNADFEKWVSPHALAEVMHFICSKAGKDIRKGVYKVYGGS
ncbi:MAG: SDR family NAD(P)-dependent oxidoreductase [Bacteroidota bacterium]